MSLSTFMGIETALRGVMAQQRAVDSSGHNIANANTEGYTRQTATMTATSPFVETSGAIGTGVDITGYQRARDAFLDIQLRAQTMLQGYNDARADGLNQVELSLNEPSDTGISKLLQNFWSGWQDVGSAPENSAVRQSLLQKAASLAGGLQSLRSQLVTAGNQVDQNLTLATGDLNKAVADVAAIDQQIMTQVGAGVTPANDLLDRRDSLLDKIGNLVNMTSTPQADGSVTIKVGDFTLLAAGAATPVATVADFGNNAATGLPNLTSGKLCGLVDLKATIAGPGGYISRLDAIASSLIGSVNAAQTSGYTLSGTPATIPFFTGTDASNIAVSAGLIADPTQIGASAAAGQPANGQNAAAIANLRGNAAIDGAYSTFVTTIGSDAQAAERTAENTKVLTDSLLNRRDSVSGVSLDEEMTNLLRFQRGYQASARALTAMDDLIDYLVNRTGKVGL
jgi:flagellar hook-associated protein 1 FlgK